MFKTIESALKSFRTVLIQEQDLNNDYENMIDEVTNLSEKIESVLPHVINFLQDYHDLLKEEERDGTADDVWSTIEDLKELKEKE